MGRATIIPNFVLSVNLGSVTPSEIITPSEISIFGEDMVTGSYKATRYTIGYSPVTSTDRLVDWSIQQGEEYAMIDSNGELTILPNADNASVTIKAALHSTPSISATKTISVSSPALPEEYQSVAFLQGDGSAYIDLGFKPNLANDSAVMKCQVAAGSAFNVGSNDNSSRQMYFSNVGAKIAQIGYAKCVVYTKSAFSSGLICNDGQPHTFHFDGSAGKFYFDGTLIASEYPSYDSETYGNMKLFGTSFNGYYAMKIYSYMHIRRGELLMYCVPCYRKSDGVAGMYDHVKGTFFTNNGSGAFTY